MIMRVKGKEEQKGEADKDEKEEQDGERMRKKNDDVVAYG